MLVNSGIILIKFYFSVSKEEQNKRFKARETDPLKQYKLSPVDKKGQELWDQYTLAKYYMLLSSNTDFAPWTIIMSDNKKKARINAIKYVLSKIDYPKKDKSLIEYDDEIIKSGAVKIRTLEETLKGKIDNG